MPLDTGWWVGGRPPAAEFGHRVDRQVPYPCNGSTPLRLVQFAPFPPLARLGAQGFSSRPIGADT
jgi:hypothetical protein